MAAPQSGRRGGVTYAVPVPRVIPGLVGLVAAAVAVTGCSALPDVPASAPPEATASPEATPDATATAQPVGRGADGPRPSVSASPTASTGQPFQVDGIVVVSKDHRLSSSYVPPWAGRPNGLHPDVSAAFKQLQAGAKADGLTITLRSGYRSWATQKDSFTRALQQYPEKTARLYFAEPGASEHQTGLALDAWDGQNRGAAFARTPHAAWLAEHAHEYGFIIRYPQDKTHITGYAWESWHLRWVGTEVSSQFGPHSNLTLEEFLGLA